jgi:hypothetical protein
VDAKPSLKEDAGGEKRWVDEKRKNRKISMRSQMKQLQHTAWTMLTENGSGGGEGEVVRQWWQW